MRGLLTFFLLLNILIPGIPGYSQVDFTSSNLPILLIEADGQEIPDEEKITLEMKVIYHGPGVINYVDDNVFDYDGLVGIERRGSSSMVFPKQSYSFETRDEDGENLNVSLAGLPEENDWVLYGPFCDKTLMRNILAYELWRKMGHISARSRLCEVMIDDDYIGVYVLQERIKRDEHRVNINKMSEGDTLGEALTGGYILQVDRHNNDGWISGYNDAIQFEYIYPDGNEIMPAQKGYIQNRINSLEDFLVGAEDTDADSIDKTICTGSFVDFMLLNEITKNIDAYRLSTYLYKDNDDVDPRVVMGPVWDYNFAFGNFEHYNGYTPEGFMFLDSTAEYYFAQLFWFRKLYTLDFFRDRFRDRWQELRQTTFSKDSIDAVIDSIAQVVDEAKDRNFEKWDILGQYIWPNYFYGQTYKEDVELLKGWISDRIDWMDGQIMDVGEYSGPGAQGGIRLYPQPFGEELTIRFTGQVPKKLEFKLLDSRGAVLMTEQKSTGGSKELKVDTSHLNLAPGIYFFMIVTDSERLYTGKLVKS